MFCIVTGNNSVQLNTQRASHLCGVYQLNFVPGIKYVVKFLNEMTGLFCFVDLKTWFLC